MRNCLKIVLATLLIPSNLVTAQFIGDSLSTNDERAPINLQSLRTDEERVDINEDSFTLSISKDILIDSIHSRLRSKEFTKTYDLMLEKTLKVLRDDKNLNFENVWTSNIQVDSKRFTRKIGYYELLLEKEDYLVAKMTMQDLICSMFTDDARVEYIERNNKMSLYLSTEETRLGVANCITSDINTLVWICPPIIICELPALDEND